MSLTQDPGLIKFDYKDTETEKIEPEKEDDKEEPNDVETEEEEDPLSLEEAILKLEKQKEIIAEMKAKKTQQFSRGGGIGDRPTMGLYI